ncbi:hypothetical protein B0H14DRAFT_2592396 [Mycena olivaceomarginata]|nr:hypothetical protein B0H14DRAFT_2592396 [Mycena olivaceomarginata]
MAAEEQDRLSQAYGAAGAPNFPDIHPSEASQVPQMFPQLEDNMDIDSDLPPINIPHLIDELDERPQTGILGPGTFRSSGPSCRRSARMRRGDSGEWWRRRHGAYDAGTKRAKN